MADFTQRLNDSRNDSVDLIKRMVDVLNECFDYAQEIKKFDDRGNPVLIQDISLAVAEAEQYLGRAR